MSDAAWRGVLGLVGILLVAVGWGVICASVWGWNIGAAVIGIIIGVWIAERSRG